MAVSILPERPDSADAAALIEELEGVLAPLYPVESRHGYSIEKLIREGVVFFVIRVDGQAVGCGGVKLYGTDYGEVKRMYVRPAFRGMGLAKAMLLRLEEEARAHGTALLRLETGIHQVEAVGLYEDMGFYRVEPFGEYRPDPLSIFFEKGI